MGKPFDCPKCGEEHPRGCKKHVRRCECGSPTAHGLEACPKCLSTNINEESPCRNSAPENIGSCRTHGVNTKTDLAIARRKEEARALSILDREGIAPLGHPVEELLEYAAVAKTAELILRKRMGDLSQAELSTAAAQAWERALRYVAQLLIDLSRLGLEDRKVQLDEIRVRGATAIVLSATHEWTRTLVDALPEHAGLIDAHLKQLPLILQAHFNNAENKGLTASP